MGVARWPTVSGALLVAAALTSSSGAAPDAFPGRPGLIVFSSERSTVASGELYTIRPDGSGRLNVTRNPAPDAGPAWSPDGRVIAFSRAGRLFTTWRDGSETELGDGSEPVWSPDGSRIAFVRDEDLWVMNADGSARLRLTTHPRSEGQATWSPDGRRIAFARPEGGADANTYQLVTVDASGGGERVLVTSGTVLHRAGGLAWTRDGSSLLYTDRRVVSRIEAEGGGVSIVATARSEISEFALSPSGETVAFAAGGIWRLGIDGALRQLTESGRLPAWSPDGRRIAYVEGTRIATMEGDGGERRRLPPEHPGATFRSLSWSPDGSRLLFATDVVEDSDLYAVGVNGGAPRPLTSHPEHDFDPDFSPDGQRIAFTSLRSGSFGLYVINTDGSGLRRLARTSGADPSWSPDGSRLVFESDGLHAIRADGTGERRVTNGEVTEEDPAWSPDGRTIVFSVLGDGDSPSLFTVRPDGRERRRLTQTGLAPAWSPDGRMLAFAKTPFEDEILLARRDGSGVRRLGGGSSVDWSPTGKELVIDGIRVVTPSGELVRRLADEPGGQPSWQPRCTALGGRGPDRLKGTSGDDLVCGLGGDDTIEGRGGSDRLFGEEGDDSFLARDGRFDIVGCGPGVDRVVADRGDLVGVDCERVSR